MEQSEVRKWRRTNDADTKAKKDIRSRKDSRSPSPRPSSSSRHKSERKRSDRSPRPTSRDQKKKKKEKKRKSSKKKKKRRDSSSTSSSDSDDSSGIPVQPTTTTITTNLILMFWSVYVDDIFYVNSQEEIERLKRMFICAFFGITHSQIITFYCHTYSPRDPLQLVPFMTERISKLTCICIDDQ